MTLLAPSRSGEDPLSGSPSTTAPRDDPVATAIHLRPPVRRGLEERFRATDPSPGRDVARHPRVARLLRSRKLQFFLILPNQLIFWLVIFVGILGTAVPGLNFGNAITWYIWFCLVFVLMVVVGRAWCSMCPFGGFAEWVQRRALWQRTQRRLGLGRRLPEPVARYGFLLSVGSFLALTFVEEYFNIAGPGWPAATSFMVLGIVVSALAFFLVFERRTFCRYFCPLSALIGTVGAMGSVAGFRTRERSVCLSCPTKDCMRGGDEGYGCPWYTWPGSADSNLACGLCSECYKSCPSDNVGLFLQPPLTSVVAPRRRRLDVAWAVAVLWGLVIFQQVNATNGYTTVDNWLNKTLHFPQYPDPVDYFGIIAIVALMTAALFGLLGRALVRPTAPSTQDPLARADQGRPSRFRTVFVPLAYGLIPVVGADYFARQLPKFFKHASRLVPSVGAIFGEASKQSALYHTRLLSNNAIIGVQVGVILLGLLASWWATDRIVRRELFGASSRPALLRISAALVVLACAGAAGFLYVIMHAAS
jgi:NosR/NirI family nitrous oxide reductase transcriptional regulator